MEKMRIFGENRYVNKFIFVLDLDTGGRRVDVVNRDAFRTAFGDAEADSWSRAASTSEDLPLSLFKWEGRGWQY